MIVYERAIRFEEVDAARIVFMGRFVGYAHEAMEVFFDPLEGGYARLIIERGIGMPAVHIEMKFSRPARYGDVLRIETSTARVGNRSAVLRYVMRKSPSAELVAEMSHTIVTTDLAAARSVDMPADVRSILLQHLAHAEE